jgi:DNA polymerase-3 subunit gamma/tau
LAKALNCLASEGPTVEPCGTCDSCREIASGNSLDVLEFDAASNTQVDKVRELIIENVKFAPARGRYKVYLVDEVHMLSTGSFNALLKTLEEPPGHVKFLFATTDVQKLPATILSRCQRFDLKRIGASVIAGHLLGIARQESVELSPEAAMAVAVGADGGMRDAESMLDQLVAFCGGRIGEEEVLSVFGFTSQRVVDAVCEAVFAEDAPGAMRLVHEQAEAGRDLSQMLRDLVNHARNLLMVQADPKGVAGELGEDRASVLRKQAEQVDRQRLLELIDLLAGTEQKMKWASNKQMYLEVALLRAMQLVRQVTLDEVLGVLTAIREGRPPEAASPRRPAASASSPAPPVAPAVSKPVPERKAEPVRNAEPGGKPEVIPPATRTAPPVPAMASAPAVSVAPEGAVAAKVSPVLETPAPQPAPVPLAKPVAPRGGEEEPGSKLEGGTVEELWPKMVKAVREQRGLISSWLERGVLVECTRGLARLGFPPEEKLAAEYLMQAGHRSFLEGVLKELCGEAIRVETLVKEDLVLRPVDRAASAVAAARDPMEEFKDDPLIRKALELFRARLETH